MSAADHLALENRHLRARVVDPRGGWYAGARFDGAAMVHHIEALGHAFFTDWSAKPRDPSGHDNNALGTAEEFDIDGPASFGAAAPGGTFVKVGVGELRRPDAEPYRFFRSYEVVRRATWETEVRPGRLHFRQRFASPDGAVAYELEKVVRLDDREPGFTVERSLRNRASSPLVTEHYCHHLLRIDERRVGDACLARLPFPATAERPFRDGLAVLEGGVLTFRTPALPAGRALFTPLAGMRGGGDAADHGGEVSDNGVGVGYAFSGTPAPRRYHLYAEATVLSLEPFVLLALAPGATARWRTAFRFFGSR